MKMKLKKRRPLKKKEIVWKLYENASQRMKNQLIRISKVFHEISIFTFIQDKRDDELLKYFLITLHIAIAYQPLEEFQT